ncbi:hypothetical protein SK128_016336, partial [Halocaridina rubra]
AGVLYIVIHGADNIGASEYPPSPYCLVFNNRRKIKTTHYVSECASPRWECGVEMLVTDVSAVTLSVAVCSMPRAAQDTELLGLASLSLATVELPLLRYQLPLTRSLPTPGGGAGSSSQPGTVTVTLVFRSVPSVAGCNVIASESGERSGPSSSSSLSHAVPTATFVPTSSQRRTSLTGPEDDDAIGKKRNNTHWINQAKQLLSTTRDGEAGTQDIGDIIASGLGLIELTIIRAQDLVAKDLNGFSDPYCVVKVNGEVKYRTRVMKKTLNPQWDETLITHLPKPPDALAITLWDHDAFGRDFLGSVTLKETEVRQMSVTDGPIWCALDGTKSGQLEIRVKLISDDYEHRISSQTAQYLATYGMISEEASSQYDPADNIQVGEEHAGTSSGEDSGIIAPQQSPSREDEESAPRIPSHSESYANNSLQNHLETNTGRRASESTLLYTKDSHQADADSAYGMSMSQTCDSPTHSSRSRKTGARIIASALAMARSSKGRVDTQSDGSNASSPTISHQSSNASSQGKPLPKISLTEHSEDDYGGSSSPEHVPKTKKTDGGLRAVREKMRRGFAHPLRRFRSEANVRDAPATLSSPDVQSCESPEPHVELTLAGIGTGMRLGVGGGEGDASELLDATLGHAKSQPNLLLLPCNTNQSASSTKLGSESGHIHRMDVFTNIRGVAGRVQGLHIPRSGLQLFLRVRISDEKHSSGGSSSRSTKTIGRSRLVPASPSPNFECDWMVEGDVSRRAAIILEVRTGSRELLNSTNVVLGDLFTGKL